MSQNNDWMASFKDIVFLVSYPRSGNTWLRFLLGKLCLEKEIDFLNLNNVIPYVNFCSYEKVLNLGTPKIIKSHSAYDKRYKKVIYVVRDVRDVVISYYYFFLEKKKSFNLDFDAFLKEYAEGKVNGYGGWKYNVESWLNNQEKVENGFLLIKYEDLKTDTYKQILKIIKFLGIKRSDVEIREAIQWASFNNMKRLAEIAKKQNIDNDLGKNGKSKGWVNVLTNEQKNILKMQFSQLLIDLGYEKSLNW